jgi:hypothetical protein
MTPGQIRCAEILVRKRVPDLQRVEVTGAAAGPLQIEDGRERILRLIATVADRIAGEATAGGQSSAPAEPAAERAGEPAVGMAELVGEA